jgi:hypothetical protein
MSKNKKITNNIARKQTIDENIYKSEIELLRKKYQELEGENKQNKEKLSDMEKINQALEEKISNNESSFCKFLININFLKVWVYFWSKNFKRADFFYLVHFKLDLNILHLKKVLILSLVLVEESSKEPLFNFYISSLI